MPEIQSNSDENTKTANEVRNIAVVNGQGLRSRITDLLKGYEQWEADIISEDKLWWPACDQDAISGKLYDTMMSLQEKRNNLLKELIDSNPVFEPTNEQIEQASIEYLKEICPHIWIESWCKNAVKENAYEFKWILARLKKIIGENVR